MQESRPVLRMSSASSPGRCAAIAAGLGLWAAAALAQAPVNLQLNTAVTPAQPTGRLFDANPQLGVRQNFARPVSPLLTGNATASGLAGYGLSLRSVSPIPDPTAFRGPLGSATLYTFRRDSVSVGSEPLGMGQLGRSYYDVDTTVPTVGFLQGLTPGTSTLGPSPLDRRIQTRMDLRITPQTPAGGPSPPFSAQAPFSPLDSTGSFATTSSLFGVEPPPRLPLPTTTEPLWRTRWKAEMAERMAARKLGSREDTRMDMRLAKPEDILATPLDSLLRSDLYAPVGLRSPTGEVYGYSGKPGLIIPEPESADGRAMPIKPSPRVTDPSVLPGYDAWTDMKLAAALVEQPDAPWFAEMRQAVRERPELASQVEEPLLADANAFVDRALRAPLRTMTASGASAFNDQMLKAESLMAIGHYGEAADRYASAALLDPTNPLPLIGQGHALLAQGQYRSAASALLRGIEIANRTPVLAASLFRRLDLRALMGGGEIIDIRRADILQQLEQRENPELRFLLGYLEYHSGDRRRGLENLNQAAAHPLAPTTIAQYPRILGEETAPPLPATEPGEPAVPDTMEPPAERLVLPPREP